MTSKALRLIGTSFNGVSADLLHIHGIDSAMLQELVETGAEADEIESFVKHYSNPPNLDVTCYRRKRRR